MHVESIHYHTKEGTKSRTSAASVVKVLDMHTLDKHLLIIRGQTVRVPYSAILVCEGGVALISSLCRFGHSGDSVSRIGTFLNCCVIFVENCVAYLVCAQDKAPQSQPFSSHSRQMIHFQQYFLV